MALREKDQDRRVQRTRQLLNEALIALILEKGYDNVTVQDIIDRANVGRSTFYAHFLDKDDLLFKGFERLLKALETQQRERPSRSAGSDIATLGLGLFQHVQQQYELHKALLGKRGSDFIHRQIQKHLATLLQESLKTSLSQARNHPVPIEVLIYYLSSTLLNLLMWWLDNDMPYSAERMNEIFLELIRANLP